MKESTKVQLRAAGSSCLVLTSPFSTATECWLGRGGLTVIIDDNYIVGPPVIAFEANMALAEDLKEVGLKLNSTKSKYHIDPAFRDNT